MFRSGELNKPKFLPVRDEFRFTRYEQVFYCASSSPIMAEEHYHGWLIEILMEAEGYIFNCWLPGNRLAVSDRQNYPTIFSARIAAKHRADTESVKWALKHCYSTYIQGSLNSEEFSTLEGLISEALSPNLEANLEQTA